VDTEDEERTRALSFLRETDRRAADTWEAIPGGAVLLTPRFPLVWDGNHVQLDGRWAGTAEELDAALERALGSTGLGHRMVVCEHVEDAQRLAPGLARLGYVRQGHLVMALRRPSERTPSVLVEDVPVGAVAPVRATAGGDPPPGGDRVVAQILGWGEQVHERLADRWLAAFCDGVPAACARVISDGAVGQVEDVTTLPEQRNRGLATSVVLGGIDRLRAEGVELVLIVVDEDNGPLGLYTSLGFDPLALLTRFRKS
jgi:ribosomal protein S18 acetylase RimI-like enzyme